MQRYGRKKIVRNFEDSHPRPKRLWCNWWEFEIDPGTKASERRKNKVKLQDIDDGK